MKRHTTDLQTSLLLLLKTYRSQKQQESGYILVATLGILMTLMALLVTYAATSQVERSMSKAAAKGNSSFYAAEAGLNWRAKEVRDKFFSFGAPKGTSPKKWQDCTDSSSGNNGTEDLQCITYEIKADGENPVPVPTYVATRDDDRDGQPDKRSIVIPAGEAFAGLTALEDAYTVSAVAMGQHGSEKMPQAILEMDMRSRVIPMFQFAAFYAKDLEILPGPQMVLNGRVHTNADLYVGAGELLRIEDQITTAGKIFNKRKNDNSTFPCGRVTVARPIIPIAFESILRGFNSGCSATTVALNPTLAEPIWGNRIKTGIRPLDLPPLGFLGVPDRRPAVCNSTESADGSSPYYCKADLRVEYRPNSTMLGQRASVNIIKRNRGQETPTALSTDEVRSMFQPVLALGDACPATPPDTAQPPLPPGRRAAISKLLALQTAPSATSNNPLTIENARSTGNNTPMWEQFLAGTLPNYLNQSITRLSTNATSTSTSIVLNSLDPNGDGVEDFSPGDVLLVGSDYDNPPVLSITPATRTITFAGASPANRLGSNQSTNAVVAKLGTTLSAAATSTSSTITVTNARGTGWEVGDSLYLDGIAQPRFIQRIDGNTITFTTPLGANLAANTTRVRSATQASQAKTPSRILDNPATTNDNFLRDCIRPAPLQQATNFYNNREKRTVNILQLSLEGLTLWNRDGIINRGTQATFSTLTAAASAGAQTLSVDSAANFQVGDAIRIVPAGPDSGVSITGYTIQAITPAAGANPATIQLTTPLPAGTSIPTGSAVFLSADQKLFDRAPAAPDNAATTDPVKTFAEMGLAAADRTEGGLVFHLTVNGDEAGYSAAKGKQSPYGFALTRGANLPGPLAVATDQAIYVQGDYNCNRQNPAANFNVASCDSDDPLDANDTFDPPALVEAFKLPASVMADSLNVLSNACVDNNNTLNCGKSGSQPGGSTTTIHAAFLTGVDDTGTNGYNGGLENYPRFHENWGGSGGARLFYRGSLVSLGNPEHVSGKWSDQVYTPPARRWQYDTDFNSVDKLPPLTPRFVYLRQELFVRDFNRRQ